MYYGLELRAPFLNPEIVDYSSCLPINKKVTSRKSKIILTDIIRRLMRMELKMDDMEGGGGNYHKKLYNRYYLI